MKARAKDFATLILVILCVVLICNFSTPFLYNKFGGVHRTTLLLDKLNEPGFKPDLIVFGSSKAMFGINCYQMSEELGVDAYSFTSTSQLPVESSLYYAFLPSSVKTVVQIIEPPVHYKGSKHPSVSKLRKTIVTAFAMGRYKLQQDTKDINPHMDLTALERNAFLQNFDARASIFIPGLTDLLLPQDKAAAKDLKYCNSFLTKRHKMYDRTIDQVMKNSFIHSNIEIDTASTAILNGYAQYLARRGIKMVAVIMPGNPDAKWYSDEQAKMIGEGCKELIPDATVLDYLTDINDTQLFYDAVHLNRDGAEVFTSQLDSALIEKGIVRIFVED